MSNVAGLTPAMSITVAVLIRAYFIISSLPGAAFMPAISPQWLNKESNHPPQLPINS